MNAGLIGMLLYSAVFGFILLILDKIQRLGIPFWIVTGISLNPVHSIIKSSDLITGLFTHGLAVTLIVLLLITPTFYERKK